MSRRNRSEPEILSEALVHLEAVQRYSSGDLDDQMTLDAIAMRLSAGIEALSALDPESAARIFGNQWPAMRGMRNRLAHGYLLVDPDIVRSTVVRDVPKLIRAIEQAQ